MSATAADTAFVALNAGTVFTTTPGLYELRITAGNGTANNDRNAFGVDIRNGAGAHYNVYTWATDDDTGAGTTPPTTDTSFVIGALETNGNEATITNDILFYPNVIRGCSVQTSNYDMDGHASASAGLNPILGASTPLSVSGGTADVVNTATVHTSGLTNGVQSEVLNYGMYSLQNDTGTQFNIIDWRVADWRGFADDPGGLPPDPTDPLRTYLPNGYTGGAPPLTNLTAPGEPVLMATYAYVSGANPPAVAPAVTRLVVQVELTNSSPAAILLNGANDQIVSALPAAGASGLGNVRCFSGSFFTNVGTAVNGGTFARCNFAGANFSLASGSSVILSYQFNFSPATAGTHFITRVPAAPASGTYNNGGLAPNTTTWAQYTRFPGGTLRPETLGPICDLRAATGSAVTRASLAGLRVNPSGEIEFATVGQRRTAAFNLYATHDASGRGPRTLLTPEPVKALVPDSLGPLTYRAQTGPVSAPYVLVEEIETTGRTRLMGPIRVGDTRLRAGFERGAASEQAHLAARSQPRTDGSRAAGPSPRLRTASVGVKVEVDAPGRVTIPLSELRAAGLPARLRPASLKVTNEGSAVAVDFVTSGAGQVEAIAFDNPGLVTPYTETNVFIVEGRATRRPLLAGITRFEPSVLPGSWRVEKNRFYAPGAPLGGDPWLWDFAIAGEAWPRSDDPDSGSFDLPELMAPTGTLVPVHLRLSSVTGGVHAVEAKINGTSVGSLMWSGRRAVTLSGEVPSDALLTQGNALSLEYTVDADASEGGLLYVGSLDFDAAPSGALPETAYRLSPFAPASSARRFAGVDYLIVTHASFRDQANRIASLKRSEGYRAAVADVQAIYDQYTTGITEAAAVGRFITEVARLRALKYVLLVGDDSFDPMGRLPGSSASFVPSLYAWDAEFGRIPSEALYADVNGDQSPDLAIGRLPVQTEEEADALVAKIARQGTRPTGKQVFAVDNEAPGDPAFESMAEQARSLLGSPEVTWARLASGTDAARQALREGIRSGAPATHFFGHASFDFWADEHLLETADVASLAGSPETVVFAWACESQWFLWPFGPSLGEALLLQPVGGASASFGPTGITEAGAQAELLAEVYPRFFNQGLTLGEAVRRAKAAALARHPGRLGPVVHGFNLLGDPSLKLAR
jgi:hypothetical protein